MSALGEQAVYPNKDAPLGDASMGDAPIDEAPDLDVGDASDDFPVHNFTGHGLHNHFDMYGEGGLAGVGNYDHFNHGDDGTAPDYMNDDYYFNDEPFYKRMLRKHGWALNYVTYVLIVFLVWSFLRFHQEGVKNWWTRRRAAARYKNAKKDDEAAEDTDGPEPSFMETLKATFTKDKSSKCTVDTGVKVHTMDAQLGTLERVSELPFLLQQACRYSGNGELAALSLVDFWLHDRARIQLTSADGQSHEVGKHTTPPMIRRARSFRITILPQTTR